jgi:hypothetical protein
LVAPAVLDAFRSKDIVDAVPADVVDFFEGIAALNRQRNERLQTEAIELAAILNGVGVVPVFLKGAAHLVSGLYSDPAQRVMVDLDVLVRADRLSDCVACLQANGYKPLTDADFSGHHHHPPLGRPGTIASVELHDEALDLPYRRLLPASEVLASSVLVERGTAKFAVPSGQCRMIHAIAHAQLSDHAYVYGQLPLRELLDFAKLEETFRHTLDWVEIARRFAESGTATALGFHVLAAERLLGVPNEGRVPVSATARAFYRRALWQAGHPAWSRLATRLLRPHLLLCRSLSDAALRRRLLRSLGDASWYRRQWRMFRR